MKVKELSFTQRCHLAWRLDHCTCIGYCTAGHIARMEGDWGDKEVSEIFEWGGKNLRAAKIQQTKVKNFKLTSTKYVL